MRPEILFDLFKSVTTLQGVGPRHAKALETVTGGDRLVDLLWHLPVNIIDRRYAPTVAEANTGVVATMTVEVVSHKKPHNRRSPYKVECRDETGYLTLVFFHAHEDYLKRELPEGETRVVSGVVERFSNTLQMTHPDHIGMEEETDKLKRIEPVYGLTAGLSLKAVDKAITAALEETPELPEWLDEAQIKQQGWQPWKPALSAVHTPDSAQALEPTCPARQRLAYDELLANQLALAVVRRTLRRQAGRPIVPTGKLSKIVLDVLPF